MYSELLLDIAIQLDRYLNNWSSLDDLDDWLTSHTWGLRESDSLIVVNLVRNIEHLLGEYMLDYWSEDELRQHLKSQLQDAFNLYVALRPSPYSFSSSETVSDIGGGKFTSTFSRHNRTFRLIERPQESAAVDLLPAAR